MDDIYYAVVRRGVRILYTADELRAEYANDEEDLALCELVISRRRNWAALQDGIVEVELEDGDTGECDISAYESELAAELDREAKRS